MFARCLRRISLGDLGRKSRGPLLHLPFRLASEDLIAIYRVFCKPLQVRKICQKFADGMARHRVDRVFGRKVSPFCCSTILPHVFAP